MVCAKKKHNFLESYHAHWQLCVTIYNFLYFQNVQKNMFCTKDNCVEARRVYQRYTKFKVHINIIFSKINRNFLMQIYSCAENYNQQNRNISLNIFNTWK